MIRCMMCGAICTEGSLMREAVGYEEVWGKPEPEYLAVCPECGGSEFEPCGECGCCGEIFEPDMLYSGLCAECLRENIGFEEGRDYLIDIDEDRCADGAFCRPGWSDFLLSKVAGAAACENPRFLLELIGEPEPDFACWNGRSISEEMRDYIMEDAQDFAQRSSGI